MLRIYCKKLRYLLLGFIDIGCIGKVYYYIEFM